MKPEFKVIIAGSRNFLDYYMLRIKMNFLLKDIRQTHEIIIISGAANGADKLGEKYAEENNFEIVQYIPDWNTLGKKAGYIRNENMAKIANACVVFWDGSSKGSKHMIDLAKRHKLKIKIVKY